LPHPGVLCHLSIAPRLVRPEGIERDLAGVVLAMEGPPGDEAVGLLPADLGLPGVLFSADLGLPLQMRVVELSNRLHALHETGELLELSPLVVGHADRYIDFDGLLDRCHEIAPLDRCPLSPTRRCANEPARATGWRRC